VRARELGVLIGELEPGRHDAITDVEGVRVGHATIVDGDDVRTGVSVIVAPLPAFAAPHRLNGNGEMTGLQWVCESGQLTTPIALTNTHSVGAVHEALIAAAQRDAGALDWSLPVVAETWDGFLNDIDGFHVRERHVLAALANASGGAVAEGNVGGGTGMICHGFKGGIGTASRVVDGGNTVGVLVQANHGRRSRLTIGGVPVGRELGFDRVPGPANGAGSIIVVVATDAPLLPHQLRRLAQRATFGIARTGGAGENSSGDLALAFSTGNDPTAEALRALPNSGLDDLFYAVIDATEEAIVNALLAAETMSGRGGATVHAIEADAVAAVLARYRP
jgi:D-aminopeptidase